MLNSFFNSHLSAREEHFIGYEEKSMASQLITKNISGF
jgi:hypothetical protein